MLQHFSLAAIAFGSLALVTARDAQADDGVYIKASFAYGFPSVSSETPLDPNADTVTASHIRSALGYRTGQWAIEPMLTLTSVDTHDYQMHQTTTIYDYALGGAQVKYHLRGAQGMYVRAGANRAWSQGRIGGPPPMSGGGLDAGFGWQLSKADGGLVGGFFADVGYQATWLGPRDSDNDRITCWFMSLGFGAGSGF